MLRGTGIPAVTGCEGLKVEGGEVRFGERPIESGDTITVDGAGGVVLFGEAPVLKPADWGIWWNFFNGLTRRGPSV